MPVTVDGFLKHLSDSGVFSQEDFSALESKIPTERRSQDAEVLVRQLVRLKKLTPFQATILYDDSPVPLILGNYVLQDKIGSGGMGVVYKAQHRRMKRVVAIKVLLPSAIQTANSANIVKRFLREAEAAAKLNHPNIVAAYDADEIHGVSFLAMEYVEGIDLARHVKEAGPMPLAKAIDTILQAANGLEHAHRQGIVHRDIKPANILLDSQGVVKILDMGLARFSDAPSEISVADAAGITQAGGIVGTIDFMSPEQAFDSRNADHSSDVYSLGATFFYLLTGKPMYEAESLLGRLLNHRESPIPSICAARRDVPYQIDTIFQRLVAKHKQDRYASMSDVIRELENWQKAGRSRPSTVPTGATSPTNVSQNNVSPGSVPTNTVSSPNMSTSNVSSNSLDIPRNVISAIFDDE